MVKYTKPLKDIKDRIRKKKKKKKRAKTTPNSQK